MIGGGNVSPIVTVNDGGLQYAWALGLLLRAPASTFFPLPLSVCV